MSSDSPVSKILVVAANPRETSRLRLDQEIREINLGLQRATKRDLFDLKLRLAVQTRDLRQALLEVEPQIVHFSGHGAGSDGLIFENELGQPQLVNSEALAGLFELCSSHVECVILNACYSEIQAEAISQHIDYVIGMSQAIGDKAAIEFAVGFYDALGTGKSIEKAYKFGCNAIALEGISEYLIPVLKVKGTGSSTILSARWNNEAYVSLHLVEEILEKAGLPRRGPHSHWYPQFRIKTNSWTDKGAWKETNKPVDFLIEDHVRNIKFLIEAKSAISRIDDKARFQLRTYLQYSGIQFGILIDPFLIEIYEWNKESLILKSSHNIDNPEQVQSASGFLRSFLNSIL